MENGNFPTKNSWCIVLQPTNSAHGPKVSRISNVGSEISKIVVLLQLILVDLSFLDLAFCEVKVEIKNFWKVQTFLP